MDTEVSVVSILIRVVLFLLSLLSVGFFAGAETAFLAMDKWVKMCIRDSFGSALIGKHANEAAEQSAASFCGNIQRPNNAGKTPWQMPGKSQKSLPENLL